MTDERGYVPLPPSVVDKIQDSWRRQVKRSDGTPVWPGDLRPANAR